MMRWSRVRVVDRDVIWLDYVSDDGTWRIAMGHNELERKAGKPWALLLNQKKAIEYFAELADAKKYAEDL